MNQSDLFGISSEAKEQHKRFARVYIAQARATSFPGWKATLLHWAARNRRAAA